MLVCLAFIALSVALRTRTLALYKTQMISETTLNSHHGLTIVMFFVGFISAFAFIGVYLRENWRK